MCPQRGKPVPRAARIGLLVKLLASDYVRVAIAADARVPALTTAVIAKSS
jgi:hypothetical protein